MGQIPTTQVSFNKDAIAALVAKERPAEGYFGFLVTEAKRHESKNTENHNLMLSVTLRMLKDPDNADSVTGLPVRQWPALPLANPDVEGHEEPKYAADQSAGLLSALFPDEVDDYPRRSP